MPLALDSPPSTLMSLFDPVCPRCVRQWLPSWKYLPHDAEASWGIRWGRGNQQLCGSHRKLDPNLALRVPWTKAEDAKLLALQESHGNHWADMAKHLRGRNAQMCRTRQALSRSFTTRAVQTPRWDMQQTPVGQTL